MLGIQREREQRAGAAGLNLSLPFDCLAIIFLSLSLSLCCPQAVCFKCSRELCWEHDQMGRQLYLTMSRAVQDTFLPPLSSSPPPSSSTCSHKKEVGAHNQVYIMHHPSYFWLIDVRRYGARISLPSSTLVTLDSSVFSSPFLLLIPLIQSF